MTAIRDSIISSNLAIILIWSVLAQIGIVQSTPGAPFPTCVNVKQRCSLGCTQVPIFVFPHAGEYSSKNVFCVENDSPAAVVRPYRLSGCPTTYFNALQNTSGVCTIATDENTTDLLLTTNELVPGLHSFDCLLSKSPTGMVSSSAIVVNSHALYRDFLVYVNGVLEDHYNNTNITLQVGDHFSVVARAVGNVTFITADGTNFTCVTGFACNKHTRNDVHNRYLNCYLNSPVELSDNEKTLAISVNNVELKTFVITVNEPPVKPLMSSPPDSDVEPTSTSTTIITASSTGEEGSDDNSSTPSSGMIIGFIIFGLIVLIVMLLGAFGICYLLKKREQGIQNEEGSMQQNTNKTSGSCVEKHVFGSFYDKLVNILPVDNIHHKLVPVGILTTGDIQEISHMARSESKAAFILQKIDSLLQAGTTDSFYKLLKVMETSLNDDVKGLVGDMRRALMTVFSSCCPRCDQYHDDIIRHGYMIKKVPPTETDANGNMLRTSLDQGIPLITCSCTECKIPREVDRLLRSPSMPDNWNILQLHQNRDGNPLQYNKITHIDLDNGNSVVEVLDWLKNKLPRRSCSTSVDG